MDKFLDLVAKELELDRSSINENTVLDDNIDWDSMSAITLISAIDGEYDTQLKDEELEECQSLGDIFKLV